MGATFFLIAVLLLMKYREARFQPYLILSAVSFSFAVLTRIDFVLYSILLAAILFDTSRFKENRVQYVKLLIGLAVAFAIPLILFWLFTDFSPIDAKNIVNRMTKNMFNQNYWQSDRNFQTFKTLFNVIVFASLGITIFRWVTSNLKNLNFIVIGFYVVGLLLTLYPTRVFTSPIFVIGLIYLSVILVSMEVPKFSKSTIVRGLIVIAICIPFFGPLGTRINTHDGHRYLSGYLIGYQKARDQKNVSGKRIATMKNAASIMLKNKKDMPLIYQSSQGWLWTAYKFSIPFFLNGWWV